MKLMILRRKMLSLTLTLFEAVLTNSSPSSNEHALKFCDERETNTAVREKDGDVSRPSTLRTLQRYSAETSVGVAMRWDMAKTRTLREASQN